MGRVLRRQLGQESEIRSVPLSLGSEAVGVRGRLPPMNEAGHSHAAELCYDALGANRTAYSEGGVRRLWRVVEGPRPLRIEIVCTRGAAPQFGAWH